MTQLSLVEQMGEAARNARNRGVRASTKKNEAWMAEAERLLPKMRSCGMLEFTGEAMRVWMRLQGLSTPSSPHAWGALLNALVRRGEIRDTGRVTRMSTERSHARRTPVWEFAR